MRNVRQRLSDPFAMFRDVGAALSDAMRKIATGDNSRRAFAGRRSLPSYAPAILLALACLNASDARAVPVDVELELLVDASGSINATEFTQQLNAYANAFRSTAVQNAILGNQPGNTGSAAVEFTFWADSAVTAISWTLIDSVASANAFADSIAALGTPAGIGFLTDPAGAIDLGASRFAGNGFESDHQIINISTDGIQNTPNNDIILDFFVLQTAANNAMVLGVDEINLLAIGGDFNEQDLVSYYDLALSVGGNTPELYGAASFANMQGLLEQKLMRELNVLPLPMSGWLLMGGFGLIGWVGRRRRSSA